MQKTEYNTFRIFRQERMTDTVLKSKKILGIRVYAEPAVKCDMDA